MKRFRTLLVGMVGLAQMAWGQQTFTVMPSGGDDTANIQAAFDDAVAAGPGSVVELSSGQFYTNEIHVVGFNGSFVGDGESQTTVDVLRGLDPDAPGVGEPPILFWFLDSTVTVADLTIDITPFHPAEPWINALGDVSTSVVAIWFEGTQTESSVERVAVRGHQGNLDGLFNIFAGIGAQGNFAARDPSLSANLSVGGSTLEHIAYAFNTWGLTDGEVDVSGNRFDDCGVAIILEDAIDSVFTISRNRIRGSYWWGIVVLQGLWIPIPAESQYLISHNRIEENAGIADGIGLEDRSRLNSGPKALGAVVQHNEISMDTSFGGIYAIAVDGGQLLNNIVSGHMKLGIYLAPYSLFNPTDSVPGWTLVGNNVENVVPSPGAMPWIPSTPIYLGPGTSDTTAVGGSNKANVVDLGLNNHLTGVNVGPGMNLGEVVSEAMQEKCSVIAAVTGLDLCAAEAGIP